MPTSCAAGRLPFQSPPARRPSCAPQAPVPPETKRGVRGSGPCPLVSLLATAIGRTGPGGQNHRALAQPLRQQGLEKMERGGGGHRNGVTHTGPRPCPPTFPSRMNCPSAKMVRPPIFMAHLASRSPESPGARRAAASGGVWAAAWCSARWSPTNFPTCGRHEQHRWGHVWGRTRSGPRRGRPRPFSRANKQTELPPRRGGRRLDRFQPQRT